MTDIVQLAEYAFQLHTELIRLGEEARPYREKVVETWQEQGRILDEFYLNDELCKAFGCEYGWSEYSAQADVAEALGFDPSKMSPPQRSRVCRLIIHSHYADRNLLEPGTKTRISEALPVLDELLDGMKLPRIERFELEKRLVESEEDLTDSEKEALIEQIAERTNAELTARQEYWETVEYYAEMTSREVRRQVAKTRQPPCTTPYHKWEAGLYDTKDGDLLATVKLTDHLAYYVVSRLTREGLPRFRHDEDGMGYYNDDGEFVYVLRFEKRLSEKKRQKFADSIPYCTRR